jgi:hypothetical protein
MSKAAAPVVSKAFAQQCSRQLLADSVERYVMSDSQHVCNALYACGDLGLADAPFLQAAAAAAASWVPSSQPIPVVQAAAACVPSCSSGTKASWRHCCSVGSSCWSPQPQGLGGQTVVNRGCKSERIHLAEIHPRGACG